MGPHSRKEQGAVYSIRTACQKSKRVERFFAKKNIIAYLDRCPPFLGVRVVRVVRRRRRAFGREQSPSQETCIGRNIGLQAPVSVR